MKVQDKSSGVRWKKNSQKYSVFYVKSCWIVDCCYTRNMQCSLREMFNIRQKKYSNWFKEIFNIWQKKYSMFVKRNIQCTSKVWRIVDCCYKSNTSCEQLAQHVNHVVSININFPKTQVSGDLEKQKKHCQSRCFYKLMLGLGIELKINIV